MWLMLQMDHPKDFVIASNETHSVREFVEEAFRHVGVGITYAAPRSSNAVEARSDAMRALCTRFGCVQLEGQRRQRSGPERAVGRRRRSSGPALLPSHRSTSRFPSSLAAGCFTRGR